MPKPMSAQQYIEQLKAYMAKIQSTDSKVRPNQNADRRIGTVDANFDAYNFFGGTVPVLFDGEDTVRNIQTGTHVFANDRVGVTRYGNTWAVTDNFTTPKVTVGKRKIGDTSRTANATPTADPDLVLTIPTGTWFVQFDVLYTASSTGKMYTTWLTPSDATSFINLKQCQGPGSTATGIRDTGGGSRWGSHNYTTPIVYNGIDASSYMSFREWGIIQTEVGGTMALAWSRSVTDSVATTVRNSSTVQATRLK